MLPAVLAIDTSGSWCSAALLQGERIHVRRAEVGSAHSEHLLDMVDAVLSDGALAVADCGAIAFAAGPGSFTGLRVGCAVAQGLAFGAARPVAAIGTLDAIANSVANEPGASLLVAQDARMGEVYWAIFRKRDGVLVREVGPALTSPRALREALAADGEVDLGCGNAWSLHADAFAGLVARAVPRAGADAVDVARLGLLAWRDGLLVDPADAAPIYVRNEVARTTAQRTDDAARNAAAA